MGAIVEKKRNTLSRIDEPIIINIPIISQKKKELEEATDKLMELQDVHDKNIKLAEQLRDTRKKYNLLKQQYNKEVNQKIEYYKILSKMNFNLYCPFIDKDITLNDCNISCELKYCKQLYQCKERNEQLIKHLNIYISRAF